MESDLLIIKRVANRFKYAMEFPTPEARKQYLHDHPNADPGKHTVKPSESGGSRIQYQPSKDVAKDVEDLAGPASDHVFVKKLKSLLEGSQPISKQKLDQAVSVLKSFEEYDETSPKERDNLRKLRQKLKQHARN
jgi:hypothetical protein